MNYELFGKIFLAIIIFIGIFTFIIIMFIVGELLKASLNKLYMTKPIYGDILGITFLLSITTIIFFIIWNVILK